MEEFKPNLIALSILEDTYPLAKDFLKEAHSQNIPIIAGGIHPTFSPDVVIKEDCIDMLCVGEGENAIVDLCERISLGRSYEDVTNLWVKSKDSSIRKNKT